MPVYWHNTAHFHYLCTFSSNVEFSQNDYCSVPPLITRPTHSTHCPACITRVPLHFNCVLTSSPGPSCDRAGGRGGRSEAAPAVGGGKRRPRVNDDPPDPRGRPRETDPQGSPPRGGSLGSAGSPPGRPALTADERIAQIWQFYPNTCKFQGHWICSGTF